MLTEHSTPVYRGKEYLDLKLCKFVCEIVSVYEFPQSDSQWCQTNVFNPRVQDPETAWAHFTHTSFGFELPKKLHYRQHESSQFYVREC